jgi:hypothetical protein
VRLGIAPQQLLELDEVMIKNLIQVLREEAEEIKNASRNARRR